MPRAKRLPVPEKRFSLEGLAAHYLAPENRKLLLRCAELGLRDATAAKIVHTSLDQFRNFLGAYPDFREEYEAARSAGDVRIANTLVEVAVEDRNVAALIFLAKTRLRWREKDRVVVTGEGGGPVKVEHDVKADAPTVEAAEEWRRFRDARIIDAHGDKEGEG